MLRCSCVRARRATVTELPVRLVCHHGTICTRERSPTLLPSTESGTLYFVLQDACISSGTLSFVCIAKLPKKQVAMRSFGNRMRGVQWTH